MKTESTKPALYFSYCSEFIWEHFPSGGRIVGRNIGWAGIGGLGLISGSIIGLVSGLLSKNSDTIAPIALETTRFGAYLGSHTGEIIGLTAGLLTALSVIALCALFFGSMNLVEFL